MPLPDSHAPRVVTFGLRCRLLWLLGVQLAYTITPRKFDRFGRCTHESRLLEIGTKRSTLLYSIWE